MREVTVVEFTREDACCQLVDEREPDVGDQLRLAFFDVAVRILDGFGEQTVCGQSSWELVNCSPERWKCNTL